MAPFDTGLSEGLADETTDPRIGEAVLQEQGEVFLGMGMFRDDRFETMQIGGHGGGGKKRTRRAAGRKEGERSDSRTFQTVRQLLRGRAMGIACRKRRTGNQTGSLIAAVGRPVSCDEAFPAAGSCGSRKGAQPFPGAAKRNGPA